MVAVASAALIAASQSLGVSPAWSAATPAITGTVTLGSTTEAAGAGEVVVTARFFPTGDGSWTEVTTLTDAQGQYAFESLPRGRYELGFDYVGDEGYAGQWWPSSPVPTLEATRFDLGDEVLVRDITLPLGASLSGTVRNTDGVGIADVRVTASAYDPIDHGGPVTVDTAQTTADGTYAFEGLPPAEYSLRFWSSDEYTTTTLNAGLELASGDAVTAADVTMYRFTSLSGHVECPGCGDPETTRLLSVVLERANGAGSETQWERVDATTVAPAESTDRGYYRFAGLLPGSYRIRVLVDGATTPRPSVSRVVEVGDGDSATLDFGFDLPYFDRDFSGDGNPDVLVRTSGGLLRMYEGDGASGWSNAGATIGWGWSVMDEVFRVGDFSGDGYPDLMATDTAGRLFLYRGDGSGGWLGWEIIGSEWGRMTTVIGPGDFSGDGNADLLARDAAGDLWVYPGDGAGGFGTTTKVGEGWDVFEDVFPVGDFGGGGGANVMGRDRAGQLVVFPSSGDGGWKTPATVGSGWDVFDAVLGSGDFDGNGTDDVMGRDRAGRLWLYPGDGRSGWGTPAVVGVGWSSLLFVG
jgi:hypothetical protein